ncbi:MAG: hypothetical protein KAS16_07075 [Thermoplasmata archaeon]|nr:hypothetical protein [Thermoplasmata archaeon]
MNDVKCVVNKEKAAFGILAGLLYLFFGAMQMFVWLGYDAAWISDLYIPGDVGGFSLIIISSVFLWGVKELKDGISEGVAYVYMGILLSLLFGIISLLMMGADALSYYTLGGDLPWSPLNNIRPALYLALTGSIGLIIWKDKFDLKGI